MQPGCQSTQASRVGPPASAERSVVFEDRLSKRGPAVSVILPTFNRPAYLAQALASVVRQSYSNLQIIVVNDGGQDVKGVVESFNDSRIAFINRRQNRGLPFTLNEALANAGGKYICYLGDDDMYYPNHVDTLVNALENGTSCLVAYSDLYKVYCRANPDRPRTPLSKVVEVSRDFDRFVMLYFNHVLHVSCMHHRDLLDKTGPYNESLNVLIDWDIIRRFVFFTDFLHIHKITGEFYQPVGENDRISFQRRKDKQEYTRNALTIRTTRPAKPWPKLSDLSIVLMADGLNQRTARTVGHIWRWTFYPYKLYLPLAGKDLPRLNTDMPNVVTIPVESNATQLQKMDKAIENCEGDYIAIVPGEFPIRDMWVEDSLYALLNTPDEQLAFELEDSTPNCIAIVARRDIMHLARDKYPRMPVREGLKAAGIGVRRIRPEEIPFQLDTLLEKARAETKGGNWKKAAEIYELIGNNYNNRLWMKSLEADALFRAGEFTRAARIVSWINQQRPTVDTLLLEARIKRRENDFTGAIDLLEKGEEILAGTSDVELPTMNIEH